MTKTIGLVAVIFAALSATLGQTPGEADLMARFKAEAPKAWEHYREFMAKLQGTSTSAAFDLTKGREPLPLIVHSKFKQGAGSMWWWRKTARPDGKYTIYVEGMNSRYSYTLTGSEETDLSIKQMTFFDANLQPQNKRINLQLKMLRALCPNFYLENMELPTLFNSSMFKFTDVAADAAPGQERALKVAYEWRLPKAGPAVERKGGFRVDPAHDWVVLDYWSSAGPQKISGQFDYDFTATMPLLKRHNLRFEVAPLGPQTPLPKPDEPIVAPKTTAPINREDIVEYDLSSQRGLEEKNFTLSAFGIREVNQAEWEQQQAVAELLEDNIAFIIDNLNDPGVNDGSKAYPNEEVHFSGKAALVVTPFQRYQAAMPNWRYQITEHPNLGQFRYLRFAWKRTVGPGIMLQLHALPKTWHRYYAGAVSEKTKSWGAMIRIADDPPRQWQVITRDLFQDFGPITVTGISFSPMEGYGQGFFDHVYLGRTIEDLDRMTTQHKMVTEGLEVTNTDVKAVAETATAMPMRWKVWAMAGIILLLGILVLVLYYFARPKTKTE
jgi:hypothetical protein